MDEIQKDNQKLDEVWDKLTKGTMNIEMAQTIVNVNNAKSKNRQQKFNAENMMVKALIAAGFTRQALDKAVSYNNLIKAKGLSLLTSRQDEEIQCPELGKTITRAECLDYSGDHSEACQGCPEKKKTNDLLLENKEMTV